MTNVLGGNLSQEERETTWNVLLMLKRAMRVDQGSLLLKEKWHWKDWMNNYTSK